MLWTLNFNVPGHSMVGWSTALWGQGYNSNNNIRMNKKLTRKAGSRAFSSHKKRSRRRRMNNNSIVKTTCTTISMTYSRKQKLKMRNYWKWLIVKEITTVERLLVFRNIRIKKLELNS